MKQTHTKIGLQVFAIFFAFFLGFFILFGYFGIKSAIAPNPTTPIVNIPTINQPTNTSNETWTKRTVQTTFDVPGILQPSHEVTVYFTINSTGFIQNSPSIIDVSLRPIATFSGDYNISYIEVKPVDAVDSFLNWNQQSYEPLYFSDISLFPQQDSFGNITFPPEFWNGTDGNSYTPVLFEDSGLIQLQIDIHLVLYPTSYYEHYVIDDFNNVAYQTNNTVFNPTIYNRLINFNSDFSKIIPIPMVIQSTQEAQIQQTQNLWEQNMLTMSGQISALENQTLQNQQSWQLKQDASDLRNLSLTFLVIALMLLDVSIVVFDHSEVETKKAEHYYINN